MDRDVILLGRTSQRKRMILPQRDSRATKEDVLAGPCLCIFLLDLNLADVARVLNHLGYVRLVSPSYFSRNSLCKVAEAAIHPILPKDTNRRGTNARAKGGNVGLNHAKGTMQRPKEEENDKHVVRIPESLIICASRLLDRRDNHAHESQQHHVASPARPRSEVGEQPAVEAQLVLGSDLGKVVPVSYGMYPGPKHNGPRSGDVEGDVLVKLDNAVERRLAQQRYERSAHGEENDAYIDV